MMKLMLTKRILNDSELFVELQTRPIFNDEDAVSR